MRLMYLLGFAPLAPVTAIECQERNAPSTRTVITVPALSLPAEIDGRLDEPAWAQAALLTDFHQYEPVDSRSATEPTEVRIWYDPEALYIGIIATAGQPNAVRATRAGRDKLSDDRIVLYLDTFHDQNRAFIFGVNPLGMQLDGIFNESGDPEDDYAPDFRFESRGRRTATGYEVEVRIPFASLRYPAAPMQDWGFQVRRWHAARGVTDMWTDVRRAGANFLAQAGVLSGLRDLPQGLVAEVQPFLTASAVSARDDLSGQLAGGALTPSVGVNLKAGMTRFALDATLNPDFSQIESDAAQVTVNERFALFLPEKRPFFLESSDLFQVPNQLFYSRRIVAPLAGVKFTGKLGRTGLAYLAALDDTGSTRALANVLRVSRGLGQNSQMALAATSRIQGQHHNHVLTADTRLVWSKLYFFQAQLGAAWTQGPDTAGRLAPLWQVATDRTGRAWGFYYRLRGIPENFRADLGFVPRTGLVDAAAWNRFSWYGAPGAFLERTNATIIINRFWDYADFFQRSAIEGDERLELALQWRGGWTLTGTAKSEFVVLDPRRYGAYTVSETETDERPYVPPSKLAGLGSASISIATPVYQHVQGRVTAERGQVALFTEGAEGWRTSLTSSVTYRPGTGARLTADVSWLWLTRAWDGSRFAQTIIPRLTAEYNVQRATWIRMIAQYQTEEQAALLEPDTGAPLRINGQPMPATRRRDLQVDWLAAYEPSPGTTAFLGYGRNYAPQVNTADVPSTPLTHSSERFFAKVAYHFRF